MYAVDRNIDPEIVAGCVIDTFSALPSKFKPRTPPTGLREWVTLAGVVLSKDQDTANAIIKNDTTVDSTDDRTTATSEDDPSDVGSGSNSADRESPPARAGIKHNKRLLCAALATGVKCISQEKVTNAHGSVLHDSHAEILAIRAFNRWLVDECVDLARKGTKAEGQWIQWAPAGQRTRTYASRAGSIEEHDQTSVGDTVQRDGGDDDDDVCATEPPPFELRQDVAIHMYISEAPCGDASMELVMAEQEDATPWMSAAPSLAGNMLGRGHFDRLGIVRRKPARPDAPQSLSKSCSDKLAMKQCTSLLSSLTSRVVRPENAYLRTLVVPDSQIVAESFARAFGERGRMAPVVQPEVQEGWKRAGYRWSQFEVKGTREDFAFSRRGPTGYHEKRKPSNLSALVTPNRREILINGVLQGRKQSDPKGASCVSRRKMWASVLELAVVAGACKLVKTLGNARNYGELKTRHDMLGREKVKQDVRDMALFGWKKNTGDEGKMMNSCCCSSSRAT